MSRPIAAVSWSGGKDSCLALLEVRADLDVRHALTMVDESGERSRSHGLRMEVLAAQAAALGVGWIRRSCSWATYEPRFVDGLRELAARGATHLVCGDVFNPAHLAWVQRVCAEAGLTAVEPLWGRSTLDLARAFVDGGGRARICTVESRVLGPEWLFRELDGPALRELQALGADPGGENGEYHTVVTHSPAFARPVELRAGDRVERDGHWAMDLTLV